MPDTSNLLSGAGSIAVQSKSNPHSPGGNAASGSEMMATAEKFELIDIDELETKFTLDPTSISVNPYSTAVVYRRNELQDRLIAASNQRCSTYIRILASSKSVTDMTWGSFATFLSGAASVTTPASAARVLAAGSTFSSGVMSQYDQNYFQNLSIMVISAGITRQRQAILERILKEQKNDLTIYSINRAVADALTYHAACNIISGLETASAVTKNASNDDLAGKPSTSVGSLASDGFSAQQSLNVFQTTWTKLNQSVLKMHEEQSKFNVENPKNTITLTLFSTEQLSTLRKNCIVKLSQNLIDDTKTANIATQANSWLISQNMIKFEQMFQPQFAALKNAIANPNSPVVNPDAIEIPKEFDTLSGLCK